MEAIRAVVWWPLSLGYRMIWGSGEEGSSRRPQEMAERPVTPSQIPLRPATGVTDPDLLANLKSSSNSSFEDLSFPGSASEAPLIPHNHYSHQQHQQSQQHYSILSVPIPIELRCF